MKFYNTLSIFSILPLVIAYGEKCDYWDSAKWGTLKGICGSPEECVGDNWAYWVKDQCPGDSSNRCCIKVYCDAPNGKRGDCTTTSNCNSLGRKHVSGRCPGPDNVQCCY